MCSTMGRSGVTAGVLEFCQSIDTIIDKMSGVISRDIQHFVCCYTIFTDVMHM